MPDQLNLCLIERCLFFVIQPPATHSSRSLKTLVGALASSVRNAAIAPAPAEKTHDTCYEPTRTQLMMANCRACARGEEQEEQEQEQEQEEQQEEEKEQEERRSRMSRRRLEEEHVRGIVMSPRIVSCSARNTSPQPPTQAAVGLSQLHPAFGQHSFSQAREQRMSWRTCAEQASMQATGYRLQAAGCRLQAVGCADRGRAAPGRST